MCEDIPRVFSTFKQYLVYWDKTPGILASLASGWLKAPRIGNLLEIGTNLSSKRILPLATPLLAQVSASRFTQTAHQLPTWCAQWLFLHCASCAASSAIVTHSWSCSELCADWADSFDLKIWFLSFFWSETHAQPLTWSHSYLAWMRLCFHWLP